MAGLRWTLVPAVMGLATGCAGARNVCDLYVVNYSCPTGSQAYNATVNAEVQSYQRCEDLGLKSGTPEFANCNVRAVSDMRTSQQSELQQEREFRLRAFQATQPAYQPQPFQPVPYTVQPSRPAPTTTNCMRMGDMVNCTTY